MFMCLLLVVIVYVYREMFSVRGAARGLLFSLFKKGGVCVARSGIFI
jgi:hypothetical protein